MSSALRLWRRTRGLVLIGLIALGAAALPVLLSSPGAVDRYADPADASLLGARALAEVLADHGVTVERVTTVADALAAAGDDGQLLVTSASRMTGQEASRLAAARSDLLLVGSVVHFDVLTDGVRRADRDVRSRSREPRCGLREAVRAGSAYLGGMSFSGPPGSIGCYPEAGKPTLIRYTDAGRTVTVVGDDSFLTNLHLAEDGNAALAMNLAGAKPRLIWLVDAPETPVGGEARSLGDLIPDGLAWAVVQLLIAVAVVALWRGRRIGPVVAERLPVAVRASETVEGRGRLYRARRARDRAALALRAAAVDRITPRLGLPGGASAEAITAAIAARAGQDPDRVRAALYGPAPRDDAELVALAGYLDTLERLVRNS